MGAPIDSWILVTLLLKNLDGKYKDFVHRLVTQLDDTPDFDKIVTCLYEEDRRLKRDNKDQAMAAAMKKYNKEQEEKKASRGNNSNNRGRRKTGRGRGGHNNNCNDRPSKNPNSTNYKGDGDTPECSKCQPLASGNKKRHWPFDCWTLHEEKMPEKYRNKNNNTSKRKANAAKDRPDDFEDNHGTHISAMAHLIIDQETVGDDEKVGSSKLRDRSTMFDTTEAGTNRMKLNNRYH